MKRSFFLLLFALLLASCLLPLVGYRLGLAVAAPSEADASPDAASSPAESTGAGNGSVAETDAASARAELAERLFGAALTQTETGAQEPLRIRDTGTDTILTVSVREYLIGAVAAEMPIDWPDEALKCQAVASHSYALYQKALDPDADAWLTADPARRSGFLTDEVLRSYWGTSYDENYARLAALVDEVLDEVLYYDDAPAAATYFAISNGRTEACKNVWGSDLPYLRSVDSSVDTAAANYSYTVTFTQAQMAAALADLVSADALAACAPEDYFGSVTRTDAGYVASIRVAGTSVTGRALRTALALRSTCFSITYAGGVFSITTRGYGHCVGMSQWGAKLLAEQGQTHAEILAHYYPGTVLGVG
jgi:stage II sporulation protein D